ncbi:hypothetical protein H0H92_011818 [Tricholoma furcatifolium]|nr:hypothetical protein H0H92_014265 [Tricholoma furcatifolium]KAG6806313.1 hypothetical protein H0H92_011818 [Tricholoma furcatifolium]
MTNQSRYHSAIFFVSVVFGFPEKELTSLETLSALRNLPKTDPDFYRELTEAAEVVSGVSESSEEPTYSNNFEDDSAVPMDVVLQCMAGNGLRDGFGVDDHGSITRVGSAESMEVIDDELLVENVSLPSTSMDSTDLAARPRRQARKLAPYGGFELWDMD